MQVVVNDLENEKLQIHWVRPTLRTQQQEKHAYNKMHYEAEMVAVGSKAQQVGRRKITLDARTDWVDHNTIHFGFTKLSPTGGVKILQQLSSVIAHV